MREIKAPEDWHQSPSPRLFLAGSIEMGTAEDWQTRAVEALKDVGGTILNPRRDDWDASWAQSIENEQFVGQVNWELDALGAAHVVGVYFSPGTLSPVTLLELGLFISSDDLVVYCPKGFWRKGNVDIVCARHGVRVETDWAGFIGEIVARLAAVRRRLGLPAGVA